MRRAPEEPAGEVPGASTSLRLTRESRVRRHAEYRVIQARGRRVHSAHYVWIVMPRTQPSAPSGQRALDEGVLAVRSSGPSRPAEPRLGITITKKTAQRAVARNRVKRVLREVFRRERALFPVGCDVVVVGKTGADLLGYEDVLGELRYVAPKLAAAGRSATARPDERRRNA